MSVGLASISLAEVRAVQDGVAHDVREDGRTLLQRRPVHVIPRSSPSASAATGKVDDGTSVGGEAHAGYNGSYVEVNASGTVVLAAATPSVVDGCGTTTSSSYRRHGDDSNAEDVAAAGAGVADNDAGRGQLHITIDAVPHVLDAYASAVGGRNVSRYRRDYLAFLASTIRQVFGAAQVQVQEQQGVAEAEVLPEEDEGGNEEAAGGGGAAAVTSSSSGAAAARDSGEANLSSGFPAEELYIGEGFGFLIHVDVHVLQCSGGNLFTSIAYAVHAALRALQLPAVTLHRAPGDGAGVSVEVDRAQPYRKPVSWAQLPLLCVLLVSPTGHYVVDPTLREEWALPQQVHVAAGVDGQVFYFRYQQLPSRRGSSYRLHEAVKADTAAACAAYVAPPSALSLNDCWAVLSDSVYVCQAMIHDCEEALQGQRDLH
ncbi:putative RNasePH-like proteinexosome associated protein 1 (Rrp42-like) [Leptomonas pyrrhocoris]|uniref:Putative RNasePH-like proteinexosome associated protein 1 (Rrp42-like) n=1 Tax=Leptomonas pyrrhocoris TaxID=157538 RepID=A0A0N0DS08_LEPPY|nr:putative RNasePH-like proteinexosome associated protein 1 (Rrp42-like) [Leptomonas pyrrhocoris]KPA75234.1 putative RNasePH-like proteinexosome associated protein 1 (Rrp42-like) [Leptomonas pyrrhocoris]|eukprot:XP_015653673.1 putative RNasePH-like proteinexosome associated protein 1 (Rrp42-like) [Leptomonas pyrrhocoris]